MDKSRSGAVFVAELKKTADVLEKYRMSFAARFLRRRIEQVQGDE